MIKNLTGSKWTDPKNLLWEVPLVYFAGTWLWGNNPVKDIQTLFYPGVPGPTI